MRALFLSLVLFGASFAQAGPGQNPEASEAPLEVRRDSYGPWLGAIGSVVSPYYESIFDWLDEQANLPLPSQVREDPEGLFVTVDRPLMQTIAAEGQGDVEKGVTYGFETYGIIDAPVDVVLETVLFRWGKPIGAQEGITFPIDTLYANREERLERKWGSAYRTETRLSGGGIAKDQNDVSNLIVRGNSQTGYLMFGQFHGPNGKTFSTSSMSIVMLRPLPGGKTDYRVSGRYTGQSYLIFGLDFGRKNYGFNTSKIRKGQKDFYNMVAELKNTGKISERRPAK